MNQKGLAPITIIIALVALIGGSFVISKKLNFPLTNYQVKPQTTQQPSSTSSAKPTSNKDEKQSKTSQQNTSQTKTSPTPKTTNQTIKTGTLKGKVAGGYYLKILPDTTVTLKGENINKTITTDSSGIFTFSAIPVGAYNLSFSHPDYNISDVNSVTVSEGETFYPRTINGFLKIFKPTTIKGTVYVDHNDNRQKDSSDEGLDALFELDNKIGDNSWHLYQNITADKSGNFSIDIKDGSTYKLVPLHYTYYRVPPSQEFVVDGYGDTKEYSFAYYPTASQAALNIRVFNDKNENGVQDEGEEEIDYYYAEVTNISTGQSYKTWVGPGPDGGKGNPPRDYGVYKIKLVAGNEAWTAQYKITKAEDIVTITNTSGDQTVKLGAHKLY